MNADLKLTCPACKVESTHPVQVENDKLVTPFATVRVRSTMSERDTRLVPTTCPACGLVSLHDPEILLAHNSSPGDSS